MRNRNIAKYLKPCVGGQTKEMKSHNASELHRTTFHRELGGGGEKGVWIKNEMSQSNRLGTLFLNCFKQTSWHLLELSKIVCLGPYELTMVKIYELVTCYSTKVAGLLTHTCIKIMWHVCKSAMIDGNKWTHFYIVSITILLTSKYATNEYSSLRIIHKIYAAGQNKIYAYSIYIYIYKWTQVKLDFLVLRMC